MGTTLNTENEKASEQVENIINGPVARTGDRADRPVAVGTVGGGPVPWAVGGP
jgi:hypothetical protein